MTPDPRTFVIVEQVAHGQWHCLTPDDAPAPVVNYASALSAGLLAASVGGWGLACANLEGATVLVAFPQESLRRALVMRQESRTEWQVVVRLFSTPPRGHNPLPLTPERARSYAGALVEARRLADRLGYPVLIEPEGEEARFLSDSERRAFLNRSTAPRFDLRDILDKGPHYGR